jgi:hypothetical protein
MSGRFRNKQSKASTIKIPQPRVLAVAIPVLPVAMGLGRLRDDACALDSLGLAY